MLTSNIQLNSRLAIVQWLFIDWDFFLLCFTLSFSRLNLYLIMCQILEYTYILSQKMGLVLLGSLGIYYIRCCVLGYLDTWSGFEAAKSAPWPSRGLHHFGKCLEPSDEWAGRGCCCFLMRWHRWVFLAHYRNELEKFAKLKFEFFCFNTFDVSQIFWQRFVQTRPKYSYCFFLKGLCYTE